MKIFHFAVTASLSALAAVSAVAQSAPPPFSNKIPGNVRPVLLVTVDCPATITVAATNAPSPWYPNAVLLNVQSASLSAQPPATQQMICNYSGSGHTWNIGRPIQPEFKSCTPSGKSFKCSKS